jgi:hypothetical protein
MVGKGVKKSTGKCVDSFHTEYGDTVCRVGEVLLAFSSGILTVVTFGTGFWLQSKSVSDDDDSLLYHFGLWQNCSSKVVEGGCVILPLNGPSKCACTSAAENLSILDT